MKLIELTQITKYDTSGEDQIKKFPVAINPEHLILIKTDKDECFVKLTSGWISVDESYQTVLDRLKDFVSLPGL